MREKRILVVEDSATQAQALTALLEANHFDVVIAADGKTALSLIPDGAFDLVLTDIIMPHMSGFELCHHIKGDLGLKTLPVVLLTSLTDPLDIMHGLECGADNYITKPYEPLQLLARIRNVLDTRTLRKHSRTSMGVDITFMGKTFTVNSEKEQILDLFISSVEDVINAKVALEESQRALSVAHSQLAEYTQGLQARERLSTGKYHSLMQSATDGIFVLVTDGSIVEANRRAAALVGAEPEALAGQMLERFLPKERAAEFRSQLANLEHPGCTHVGMSDVRFDTGQGPLYCELRASSAREGAEYLVLVILQDVTQRRNAEAALRESNQMLHTLIEASPLAIVALDAEARVTFWNQSAERTFGWTAGQVAGQSPPIAAPEQSAELTRAIERVMAGELIVAAEMRAVTAAGRDIDVNLWAAPLRDSGGQVRGAVALLTDISSRKTLEEQLRQAQKMEAVGTLAGGIAHDFNNVLTAISGYADVLLSEADQSPRARQDIEEIRKAALRAGALTRQLLAFGRKQMLQPRVLSLNGLVGDMEPMLQRLVREDIELRTDLAADLGSVYADPSQIERILLNLVVNARDAIPETGMVTIRTRNITVTGENLDETGFVSQPGSYVTLAVTDTGVGMSKEAREHIFEPFFTTKPKEKGSGLGLATVYGIVKQSGGYINVDTELGRGSTLTICLPHVQAEPEPVRERLPQAESQPKDELILIVEDDPAVRRLAVRVLKQAGYHVLEAENGADALRVAREHANPIQLLVTDVVMPEMSGPQLGHELVANYPGLKVLYVSGYTEAVLTEEAFTTDSAFLEKPFLPRALLAKIRELIDADSGTDR